MRLQHAPANHRSRFTAFLAFSACFLFYTALVVASQQPAEDTSASSAVCPIVYQLDQTPGSRGYRYSFFGNGFFVNEEGYLLTAAHVLETFGNGGQPYILVSRPDSPPQLLRAEVIASDPEHDVAILRATPNPFAGKHRVTFLNLTKDPATLGQPVIALSLHPAKLQNAHSFQAPQEDRSPGDVLSFETTQLAKSAPAAEVFLLSHPVTLGQSGSPILARDSQAVVGLIEGRWLRGVSLAKSSARDADLPGAAVPVRYAIALLQRHSVSWHESMSPASAATSQSNAASKATP